MDYLKGLNVTILSLLLILTGCFGMLSDDEEDSVEAQNPEDTTTVTTTLTAQDIADAIILASNSPPKVSVKTFEWADDEFDDIYVMRSNWEFSGIFGCLDEPEDLLDENGTHIGYTLEEQRESLLELSDGVDRHLANLVELGDCVIYFDFLSVDPDGDSMTKGIDTDFDGIIDIPIIPNEGMMMVAIDNSTNTDVFEGVMTSPCDQIDLAFIAVDEHGASTAEFMHFLGVESCEEDEETSYFLFSGMDAPGSDGSLILTMTQGSDIQFSNLLIEVSVDGSASQIASNCNEGLAGPCYYDDDGWWYFSEAISFDTDCTGFCTITVEIRDFITGNTFYTVTVDVE
ncbi:MAG: hypothetical protein VXY53_05235 [Candidatus Thermoplasmatota archaeon]|nr:hypothetical protein [Candidatus Thermoplasmatota archaeon]